MEVKNRFQFYRRRILKTINFSSNRFPLSGHQKEVFFSSSPVLTSLRPLTTFQLIVLPTFWGWGICLPPRHWSGTHLLPIARLLSPSPASTAPSSFLFTFVWSLTCYFTAPSNLLASLEHNALHNVKHTFLTYAAHETHVHAYSCLKAFHKVDQFTEISNICSTFESLWNFLLTFK